MEATSYHSRTCVSHALPKASYSLYKTTMATNFTSARCNAAMVRSGKHEGKIVSVVCQPIRMEGGNVIVRATDPDGAELSVTPYGSSALARIAQGQYGMRADGSPAYVELKAFVTGGRLEERSDAMVLPMNGEGFGT